MATLGNGPILCAHSERFLTPFPPADLWLNRSLLEKLRVAFSALCVDGRWKPQKGAGYLGSKLCVSQTGSSTCWASKLAECFGRVFLTQNLPKRLQKVCESNAFTVPHLLGLLRLQRAALPKASLHTSSLPFPFLLLAAQQRR